MATVEPRVVLTLRLELRKPETTAAAAGSSSPLLFVSHTTATSQCEPVIYAHHHPFMRGRSPSAHPTKSPSVSLLQIPPLRYELVETDLHRGGYPTLRNFPFLVRLRLRTLISLTPEPPTADLTLLCSHYNIALHHYAVPYAADSLSIKPAKVAAVLSIVLSRTSLPAYVHCLDGRTVTSGVVAVLRRLQYWRLDSCVAEYERMCGAGTGEAVRELLDEWSEPVRLNSQLLPTWLWDGKWCAQHPTMTLVDDSDLQRKGEAAETAVTTSTAAAVTSSEKQKLKSSSSSSPSSTVDVDSTSSAANNPVDPTAALLARWTKRRSWLYYDTLLSSQPIALPDDEQLYSVDRRMAGSTAYLEHLMLEGFTMTNTFPRPLPLLHIASTTATTPTPSSVHISTSDLPHGPHAHA